MGSGVQVSGSVCRTEPCPAELGPAGLQAEQRVQRELAELDRQRLAQQAAACFPTSGEQNAGWNRERE
jgi:hypothetical protein